MATCPECDFDEIDTDDHEEGDMMNCPECGKNLVLTGVDQLDFVDEDDDDDDLDDDEEEAADDEDALDDDDDDDADEEDDVDD